MRVFKNKWFNRWARGESISDVTLLNVAAEIAAGKVEADLGGFLFKKRIARTGSGKRGGYRIIVGYKRPHSERIIFLYAFAKSKGKYLQQGRSCLKPFRRSFYFRNRQASQRAFGGRLDMGGTIS